jgi:pyruvate/2-oxoglutarate dehydrogenase complex dihydrolipoamide acyltransferase (E2) component
MATRVIMPQLGESVVEGTVTKWLKEEGERVEEYEALVEINTDKVDTEIPAPATGTLLKRYIAEGETVGAGTLLAVVGEPGEEIPTVRAEKAEAPAEVAPPRAAQAERGRAVRAAKMEDLGFISPVVARISAEHNVDLTRVDGTGQGGRITKKDVLVYIETRDAAPAAPWEQPGAGELFRPSEEVFVGTQAAEGFLGEWKPGAEVPLDPVRKTIASHMVRSKQISPHVTTVMEVDMARVVAHRAAHKTVYARDGIKLSFTPYFVMAVASALRDVPVVNSSLRDDEIHLHAGVHIGVAVSLGEAGLIVPVIRDADRMSLRGLAMAVDDVAGRARSGDLEHEEVTGGTFTITNHGIAGSLLATPIINQPQAAILGVGAIQKRVVVLTTTDADGEARDSIAIRPMAYLSLSFDHRIMDGAIADRFLSEVVNRLQAWS